MMQTTTSNSPYTGNYLKINQSINSGTHQENTFAVGMAGGDPGRIDAIQQGVENGFQEALDAFDGWPSGHNL